MPSWKGRGGGRPGNQPTLEDSKSAIGDAGANPPDWQGRGAGRHRPQPSLSKSTTPGRQSPNRNNSAPSTSHRGDPGAAPEGWAGRGGGRHRPQPKISSATMMHLQRGALNAMQSAMSSIGTQLGLGFAARELEDPAGAYVFSLEIDGVELAHFQDCSGIKNSTEVFEIKEGGLNHAVHKLPGQSTWDNLVLSYGVTSSSSMLSLRAAILNDDYSSEMKLPSLRESLKSNPLGGFPSFGGSTAAQPKRFNGSIVIRNNKFQELLRYNFKDAWVVSWEGPKLDSTNSSLAISKVEIAHHGIEVVRNSLMATGWI